MKAAVAPTLGLFVYKRFGANALFFLAAATALLAVGLAVCITDRYVPQKARSSWKEKMSVKRIVELTAVVPSLICLFVYFGYSSVTNFVTPYGMSKGMDNIILFFTINTLTVIAARLLAGREAGILWIINAIYLGTGFGSMIWGCVSAGFGYVMTYLLSASVMAVGYAAGRFGLEKR